MPQTPLGLGPRLDEASSLQCQANGWAKRSSALPSPGTGSHLRHGADSGAHGDGWTDQGFMASSDDHASPAGCFPACPKAHNQRPQSERFASIYFKLIKDCLSM